MTFFLLKWNIEALRRFSLSINAANVTPLLTAKKIKKNKNHDICTDNSLWKRSVVEKLYKEYDEDRIQYNAKHNTIKARNLVVGLVLF